MFFLKDGDKDFYLVKIFPRIYDIPMEIPDHLNTFLFPTLSAAAAIQKELAAKVVVKDQFHHIDWVGGMDVSNNLYDPEQMIYAAMVVMNIHQTQVTVEESCVAMKQEFPYRTGFLGFREAPALVQVFHKLQQKPDVIFVDGHGIAHPRSLGIASHIGVLLDIPTIGVGKTILIGRPEEELGPEVGDQTPLVWKGEQVGTLLRTRKRANPLIISPGHRVSHQTAVDIVKKFLTGHRLPTPTRYAHQLANEFRVSQMTKT